MECKEWISSQKVSKEAIDEEEEQSEERDFGDEATNHGKD